ncbi:unnamed protein product [Caretta caretta]
MQRLKRMLRRKAGQVAPEPVGRSGRLAQEESSPSVPAGGEEASGQMRRRSSLAFWRRRKTPAPITGPEASSGPNGGGLGKQRSQEPCPRTQQEPPTSLAIEQPPAGPEQELGNSGTNTSCSAYSQRASSPSVGSDSPEAEGSLCAETPSAQLEEMEEEDVSPEQATIRVIQQHLRGRAEELTENLPVESEPASIVSSSMAAVCSLRSLDTSSLDAKELSSRRRFWPYTIPLIHVSQAGLVLTYSILGEASQLIGDEELIENLPVESEPTSIVSSSMAAVCSLSKLKPPLALELESCLLRAVLQASSPRARDRAPPTSGSAQDLFAEPGHHVQGPADRDPHHGQAAAPLGGSGVAIHCGGEDQMGAAGLTVICHVLVWMKDLHLRDG